MTTNQYEREIVDNNFNFNTVYCRDSRGNQGEFFRGCKIFYEGQHSKFMARALTKVLTIEIELLKVSLAFYRAYQN